MMQRFAFYVPVMLIGALLWAFMRMAGAPEWLCLVIVTPLVGLCAIGWKDTYGGDR